MSKTVFEQKNADFSLKCHDIAIKTLYPKLFGTSIFDVEDTTGVENMARDSDMGIDKVFTVSCKSDEFRRPIKFTVQERFRRELNSRGQFYKTKDVTFTEWNHASNLPAELYKIEANYFIYGRASSDESELFEFYCIDVTRLKSQIVNITNIPGAWWGMNPKKQSFIGFPLSFLRENGAMLFEFQGISAIGNTSGNGSEQWIIHKSLKP